MPFSLFAGLDAGASSRFSANIMLREVRDFDWASSAAGPIEAWPDPLKFAARTMLLSSTPMSVLIGREGLVAYNDATRSMFGFSYYGSLGKPVTEVLPEAADFFRNVIGVAFEGQSSSFHDQPYKLPRNGSLRTCWFDLEFTPTADERGIVYGVLQITRETTERVLAVREMHRSRERLDIALHAGAIVGTWEVDFATETVSSDERFARLHGVDAKVARNGADKAVFISGIHPDDRHQVMVDFDRAKLEGDYRCRHRVIGESGTRWVVSSGRVVMDQDGQPFSFSGVVVDVTREVEISEALVESEQRFRAYTETLPQVVFSWDGNGRNDYYNRRWREFAGLPDGPIEPYKWQEFLHPDDRERILAVWRHSLETEGRFDVETRFLHCSGEYRWSRAIALPVHHTSGHLKGWVGTLTDIHEAKLLETERELVSRELDHRIKNIFALVNGLVSLTQREDRGEQSFADRLRGRLTALYRAHDLIRPGAGGATLHRTGSSLQDLVRRLLAPYDEAGSNRFVMEGDDIYVNESAATSLALIFHELATNAAKYGALSTEQGKIHLRSTRNGGMLQFMWTETGGHRGVPLGEKSGFGSKLLVLVVEGQLRGRLSREVTSDGFLIRMELPFGGLLDDSK